MTPETVAATTPTASITSGGQNAETKPAASASALTSDFETFLNLLTAQLKNQDPLNPMESTEFVAQIAQFSSVEQQVKTNDALARIEAGLSGGGGLTQWLGAEVEAAAALQYEGEPIALTYDADPDAALATLVVSDENGAIVSATIVQPGAPSIEWNGQRGDGSEAGEGLYRFSVTQIAPDGEETTVEARGFAAVVETRLGANGEIELVLEGGDRIASSAVTAARSADAEG